MEIEGKAKKKDQENRKNYARANAGVKREIVEAKTFANELINV